MIKEKDEFFDMIEELNQLLADPDYVKRKLVIEQCEYCPFVDSYHIGEEKIRYDCNHDALGHIEERVEKNTIPEWCPLEKNDD